ncbi:MAG TPA: YcxB family protein [Acidimicrobiales bacterium]
MTPYPTQVSSIEHQLTRDEVVPVYYWQLRQRPQNFILPLAGAGLVIAAAVVLAVDAGNTEAWTVMLALGLVLLVIFNVLVPLTPGRIWKRFRGQFEERTMVISDEGIQRRTALSDSLLRWPTFAETLMRGDLYLLRAGKGPRCFIIPRRAFASERDELVFRRLIEQFTSAHLEPMSP